MDKTEMLLDKIRGLNKEELPDLRKKYFNSAVKVLDKLIAIDQIPGDKDNTFEHDELQKAFRDVFYYLLAIAGETGICFSCVVKAIDESLVAEGPQMIVMPPMVVNKSEDIIPRKRNHKYWVTLRQITDEQDTGDSISFFDLRTEKENSLHEHSWFWTEICNELSKVSGLPWMAIEVDNHTVRLQVHSYQEEVIFESDYLLEGERITRL